MHVLAFASRKGGSGKSTLAAHLALHAHRALRRCLLIDEDRQGSLTLWNTLRQEAALPIKTVKRELADVLKKAKRRDVDWVFIDTPANVSASVVDAIRAARLVIIPCRPGLLDIDAVQETIDFPPAAGDALCGRSQRRAAPAWRRRVAGRHRGARMFGGTECPGVGRPDHPPGEFLAGGFAGRGRPGTGS